MMKYVILICLTVFISCNGGDKEKDTPVKQKDSSIAAVPLLKLNGEAVEWSIYKGKAIFINFWATWCGPCLKEMPSIQAAMNTFKNEPIVFLFASDETAEHIEKFKAGHPFNFIYQRIEDMAALNIVGLPTTMIFDVSGKKVFSEMGFRNWSSQENIDLLTGIINSK